MTDKLYNKDAYIKNFEAVVLSCTEVKNGFEVILDCTAFFPEGGGQSSDTGMIDGAEVFDVQEKDNDVVHFTRTAVETGKKVNCEINWDRRYRNMQNHSGEHIVSGLAHRYFGLNNVGFHIGRDGVTVDLDGELTREQLDYIESEANKAVYSNADITVFYPDEEELKTLEYRSKIELTDNIRIVKIGEYDLCACCAPHVGKTGEIGIIKILDTEKYKGGIRLQMLCGSDALEDYRLRYMNIAEISVALSAKQTEAAAAVKRLMDELGEEKRQKSELKRELINLKIQCMKPVEGNMCIFDSACDMNDLRALVNEGINMCDGICAAFSGSDKQGYQYVIAGKNISMRERAGELNKALNGKGGGSAMIQGSVLADKKTIEEYIRNFK